MDKYTSRYHKFYDEVVVPKLMKELEIKNIMECPKLEKIIVNMGVGEATQNSKLIDAAMADLTIITGQKPLLRKAKKSEAGFKLREGMPIGAKVTLRKERMYDFLDRLVNVVLPRVRDFEGVPSNSFDGRGNYSVGLRDQLVFPEIDFDKVEKLLGMSITMVSSAKTDEEGRALLKAFGMPFKK
ncbi:50S ribosomal protein L5 [Fusobacterium nucleatum subsp. nucleatum ATCC 23726]|uniref:Large ribosomal subunit protein uL5 n=6 Tax=Fusobacterium TaxID=848 RepID=RL5_FUSNN|nr:MULTISPECIES: 50S ribosomal protein L5 [Fusobacterium]Q8RIG8.1 RecName: Full=Large ribosomal subunit protein uL5; AltName: Full=50S ribosomal protein L5 [Fusobacterium nucleatum subsp. nucleatum ATCC 25586]EAA23480.1 LSU ribosomal protein L5P [Fusobacterium vincentii ATCC 49256]AAL93747.1 LSU ribosomal protein L5P [Fusobacterium nucleatum subsp. nucleatum ATCC 25586]ALF23078.1 50S ribosomal protein L5 [Fusobacterium nucleatum subsp. nucleatum ChDC F316]ALF26040.1 50S ribosomal protein L5 [F